MVTQRDRFDSQADSISSSTNLTEIDLPIFHNQPLTFSHSHPEIDGPEHHVHRMEFFHILEAEAFEDGGALRPHPFEHDPVLFRLELLSDRFSVDRVDVEDSEPFRGSNLDLDRLRMLRILQLEEQNFREIEDTSCRH